MGCQDDLEADSDLRYMVIGGGDEDADEPEEMIDFTLATPSTLNLPAAVKEEEDNKKNVGTTRNTPSKPIIIPRKVTMI